LIALKDEQKAIEQQINQLIETDSRLKERFEWIVSVPGIGSTTATEILVVTNEMTTITDPKQMAASAVRLSCRSSPLRIPVRDQYPREDQGKSSS
jgi:transposase